MFRKPPEYTMCMIGLARIPYYKQLYIIDKGTYTQIVSYILSVISHS